VVDFLGQNSGGHVGDAGDAEHFHLHVPGDDYFVNSGHAYQVCTQSAEGTDFCRCFVAWAGHGDVDAFVELAGF